MTIFSISIYIKRSVGGWVCNAFLKPGIISVIPLQITPNLKPLFTETLLTVCLPPPSTQCLIPLTVCSSYLRCFKPGFDAVNNKVGPFNKHSNINE